MTMTALIDLHDALDTSEPTTFSTTPVRNTDMFTIERQTSSTRPTEAAEDPRWAEDTSAARDEKNDYIAARQSAITRRKQHAARSRAFASSAIARSSWATSIACR